MWDRALGTGSGSGIGASVGWFRTHWYSVMVTQYLNTDSGTDKEPLVVFMFSIHDLFTQNVIDVYIAQLVTNSR